MDVITQTKHYFTSFQTANLVEGITGLSSHYIIPSGSCKVHRRASNGHRFFFFFFPTSNNVPTMAQTLMWGLEPTSAWLLQSDANLTANICFPPSDATGGASSRPPYFLLKRKRTHKCKNKGKQTQPSTLQMIYLILICFDRIVSSGGNMQQNFIFSNIHIFNTSRFSQCILFT